MKKEEVEGTSEGEIDIEKNLKCGKWKGGEREGKKEEAQGVNDKNREGDESGR